MCHGQRRMRCDRHSICSCERSGIHRDGRLPLRMERDDTAFPRNVSPLLGQNVTRVEYEPVTIRCASTMRSSGRRTPCTRCNDRISDTSSACVTVESLSQTFAGTRGRRRRKREKPHRNCIGYSKCRCRRWRSKDGPR